MGQGDVSDTGKKKTLSLGNGEPLSLRKPGESGSSPVRGGMGGGRKTVQVEVRRRRALARYAKIHPVPGCASGGSAGSQFEFEGERTPGARSTAQSTPSTLNRAARPFAGAFFNSN